MNTLCWCEAIRAAGATGACEPCQLREAGEDIARLKADLADMKAAYEEAATFLSAANDDLAALKADLAALRAVIEKWGARGDNGFDPNECPDTVAFWDGATAVVNELRLALAGAASGPQETR